MKFRKFASWSPTKKHRERRQAEKEKSKEVPLEKRNASSSGCPTSIRNSSEQSTKLSIEKEGKKLTKGDMVISTTTNIGVSSKIEGVRPSFLFEDNEDDNINYINHGNNKNTTTVEYNASHPQITKLGSATPLTPNADLDAPLISSPKNLFHLPQEIMLDPLTVPPSPMREPNVNIMTSPGMNKRLLDDYHPGMFLNFQESSPREAALHHHSFGDPVGDIAMQRQLMDAQRLVRIILGKPLNKNQQVLGASSILQAIRSYALMKAELMDLRKKQEIIDGDPPAILLALGSPAATTPSTTRTGMCSPRRLGVQTAINSSDSICGSTEFRSDRGDANLDVPITSGLEQASKTIERLQKDLTTANDIILELQDKMEGVEKDCRNTRKSLKIEETEKLTQNNDQQHDELLVGESKQDGNPELEEQMKGDADADGRYCWNTTESISENEDVEQLIQNDEQHDQTIREESKQNGSLDLLLDEIVLIPQRVLTKDMVREKLELYYHSFSRQSSENQILQMKNEMRQSQEESDRQILEMENKMKLQHQEHEKQIQAIIMDKEQIVDTKTDKNENTILIELSHNTTSNTSGHLASSIRKPMSDNAIKVMTEKI